MEDFTILVGQNKKVVAHHIMLTLTSINYCHSDSPGKCLYTAQ